MDNTKLDETNFMLYAAKHYNNDQCYDTLEFYDDMLRFKYLKRLFKRYENTGELKERLILNHIIILYNLFDVHSATRLLFFKLREYHEYLVPFLILIQCLPEKVENIGLKAKTYITSDIKLDPKIVNTLREI